MQKMIGSSDMPAFRKNDNNGDIIRFSGSGGIDKSLNQKIN